MYSLPYITAQLYPHKSPQDLEKLVKRSLLALEYDSKSWQEVKKDDLGKEEVQLSLIKTFYTLQFDYDGAASEIIRCLEEWTDGVLLFPQLAEEKQEFYQRYYVFLGFVCFEYLKLTSQVYLLGSRFLPLALAWEIPLYVDVQNFFSHLTSLRLMEDFSMAFYTAIEKNKTPFGEELNKTKTIADWVKEFNEFPGNNLAAKVDEFLENKFAVQRLPEDDRKILDKILTLYWGLRAGFIWRELEYSAAQGGEDKPKRENKTADDYYLQELFNADQESFAVWLDSYQEAAEWIVSASKPMEFIKKLLFILFEKVDLKNVDQVNKVIDFVNLLSSMGLQNVDEIIYFDEKEQKFKWNDSFFVENK